VFGFSDRRSSDTTTRPPQRAGAITNEPAFTRSSRPNDALMRSHDRAGILLLRLIEFHEHLRLRRGLAIQFVLMASQFFKNHQTGFEIATVD
jgi:hypothetical protein